MEGGREQNFWPGFVDALSNVVLVMIFVVVVFVVTLFYYSQKLAEYKMQKFVEKRDTNAQIMHPATAGARDQANSETVQQKSNAPTPSQRDQTQQEKQDKPKAANGAPNSAAAQADNQAQSQSVQPDQKTEAKDKLIADLKNQVASLRVQLAGQAQAAAMTVIAGSTRSENETPNHVIEVKAAEKAKTAETGARLESTGQSLVLHFADDGTVLDEATVKKLKSDVGPWVEQIKKGRGKIIVSGAAGSLGYSEARRRAYYRAIAVRNELIAMGVEPGKVTSRVVPGDATTDSAGRVLLQFTTQDQK